MNLISVDGGQSWQLPDTPNLATLQKRLTAAMTEKTVLPVDIEGGVVLLVNGGTVTSIALGPNQEQGGGTPSLS